MRLRVLLCLTLVVLLAALSFPGCGGSPGGNSGSQEAPEQEAAKPANDGKPADEAAPVSLTAREVCEIVGPFAAEAVGSGAVPVFIWGKAVPEHPVDGGKSDSWSAGFYVADEKSIWDVFYDCFDTVNGEKGQPRRGKNATYRDVSLSIVDCTGGWQVDSPEACAIAAREGAQEITWLRLQVRGLEAANKDFTVFKTPDFVPASSTVFWVVQDKKSLLEYYIDASTGTFLGSKHAMK